MAEADGPAQVVVRWGGTSYTMNVTPSETVGDLKSKFADIEQLPSKRQRFKVRTMDRYELADQVLLSSLPNEINVYGLNERDDESYKRTFREHETSFNFHVTNKRTKLNDFDGKTKFGMSHGVYEVFTLKMDCLIRIADEKFPLDRASCELMRHFRHPGSMPIENIYMHGQNLCLILSGSVDGTLAGYINQMGSAVVFDRTAKTFTPFFIMIITDLCGVLDKLVAENICPTNITLDNLYLKMVDGSPQLKVLFNQVEPIELGKHKKRQLKKLCGNIKTVISDCLTREDKDVMNNATKCFCEFLGNEAKNFFGSNLKLVAESYPLSWNDERKAAYLVDVMSSSVDLRPSINICGIKWPSNVAGDGISEELNGGGVWMSCAHKGRRPPAK